MCHGVTRLRCGNTVSRSEDYGEKTATLGCTADECNMWIQLKKDHPMFCIQMCNDVSEYKFPLAKALFSQPTLRSFWLKGTKMPDTLVPDILKALGLEPLSASSAGTRSRA